jgi:DnaJ-class molecular chaperone
MPHSEWNAHHQKFTAVELMRGHTCLRQYNSICGTAYTSVDEIRATRHAEMKANKPTAQEVALVKAAMRDSDAAERKQRRAELAALKASNTCPRCHGAGGSDAWFATGWTCNRCHGTGKYAS